MTHQGRFVVTVVGNDPRQSVVEGEIKAEFCPVVPAIITEDHTAQLNRPQTLLQPEVMTHTVIQIFLQTIQ